MKRSAISKAGMREAICWLLLAACGLTSQAQSSGTSGASTPPSSATNPYTQMAPGVNGLNGVNGGGFGLPNESGGLVNGQQGMNIGQGANMPLATVLYPDPKQYVLTAGDLIHVSLFGSLEFVATQRISKDGTIELPLIGAVRVASLTIRQGEDLIAEKLRMAGMYKNPHIMITISETASPLTITLTGEMHGLYPMQGQRSLLDVLASFGGLPPSAGRVVTIIRPGQDTPILVDLGTTPQDLIKANVPVLPHDTLFIERAGAVYVLGAFKIQGAFPLPPGRLTLMQLAALSGGVSFAGKFDDLRIIRTVGTVRTEVKVDIKRVLYGKAPDPILQAGDIVFLPPQWAKAAISNGNFNTLLSVVSLFIFALRSN